MTRITLPFPPSLNNCFENIPRKGRIATQRYRDWTNEAFWMIKSQKPSRFEAEVSITIGFVAPDRRKRDLDNLIKPVLDILVKGQVIKDDSDRHVKRITAQWLPAGAPCTVMITEYEDLAA